MSFLRFLSLCVFVAVIHDVVPLTVKSRQSSQNVEDVENYIQENRQSINPRYRQKYHVITPLGWMNDPNGFSFYEDEYHLFYQFHPYSAVWGPMHWGHVKSKNLVDWEYLPTALIPGDEYDNNGCFSGSAVEQNGKHVLIYTGNIDDNGVAKQEQNLAISDDGVYYTKFEGNPVLSELPDGVPDFRDPKVWKHNEEWYMIIGNASPEGHGRVVLYKSQNLIEWSYLGVLAESDGSMGYMWECPDFFELDGKHILLMSPQGMEPSGDRYKNLHQTGYYSGVFDYETAKFVIDGEFQELDYGHDFYATQTMTAPDGRVIVIAWMDMWESDFKEAEDNWAGTMTLPREIQLNEDGRMLMKPIREIVDLREQLVYADTIDPEEVVGFDQNALEILARVDTQQATDIEVGINFIISETEIVYLYYNLESQVITLDRGGDDGIRRVQWVSESIVDLQIFLDSSSIEVFCGNGEVVFSSRIYPSQLIQIQAIGASFDFEIYTLRQSIYN